MDYQVWLQQKKSEGKYGGAAQVGYDKLAGNQQFENYLTKKLRGYNFGSSRKDIEAGYVQPDAETFRKIRNQAAYNFTNDSEIDWGTIDYDPTANDEQTNQLWASYVKKNKAAPTPEQLNVYKMQTMYEDQYDKTLAEDAEAYSKGLKPYKYQVSDKVVSEYQAVVNELQKGGLTIERARQIGPTMFGIHDTTVAAEAERAAKEVESEAPAYSWDKYTGTKASKKLNLDYDTLKQLGYDEKAGFQKLIDAIAQQRIAEQAPVVQQKISNPDTRADVKGAAVGQGLGRGMVAPNVPRTTMGADAAGAGAMLGTRKLGGPAADSVGAPVPASSLVGAKIATNQAVKPEALRQNKAGYYETGELAYQGDQNNKGKYIIKPSGEKVLGVDTGTYKISFVGNDGKETDLTPQKMALDSVQEAYDAVIAIQGKQQPKGAMASTGNFAADTARALQTNIDARQQDSNALQSGLGAGGVAVRNGIMAINDIADGKTPQWRGSINAKGSWEDAVSGMDLIKRSFSKDSTINDIYNGKATPEQIKEFRAVLNDPWVEFIVGGLIVEGITDPLNWLGATKIKQLANIVKLRKAGKIDDAARAAEVLLGQADDAGRFTNQAKSLDNAFGGVKGDGLPTTTPKAATFPRATRSPTINSGATIGKSADKAPDAIVEAAKPLTRNVDNVAAAVDDATISGAVPKATKPKDIGAPDQKVFDAQKAAPDGMAERGLSENIRTDANSPDALRDTYSKDPEFYNVAGNADTLAKAETVYAKGYDTARTELVTLTEKMKPEAVPLAKMLARDAANAGRVDEAREILADVASKLTEAGQFGQAARILRQSDPETVFLSLKKQFQKLNEQGRKIYKKLWKDFDVLPNEADELLKLNPGDEQAIETFMNKVADRVADQMPATALEKLTAWRHMAMLMNPKTHIRNMTGNVLMAAMNRTSTRLSGVLQKVTPGKLLPKELRTAVPWVKREFKTLAKEFFAKNEASIMKGGSKYNEGIGINMPNKRVFRKGPTGALDEARKANYAALDAEDKFFFKAAYTDRLASVMQARGIKSIDKLPQDVLELVLNEAEKAVFRDKNTIVKAFSKLKQGKLGFIADTIMPFTKTPVNIAMRGLDYSPVGIGKGISKLFNSKTAAEGLDDIAKGLTGAGVMALGYMLAEQGILTGAAPKDKDLAAYDKATGNAPFSIMGEVTYDWAQPFAIPLTVGVAIHDAIQDDPQTMAKLRRAVEAGDAEIIGNIAEKYGLAMLDAFSAAGDTMFNMSVLQGIQGLFNNPNGFSAGLAQMPSDFASQMIPTTFGQVARAVDPTIRQTYYGTADIRSQTAPLINKIPFASATLPAKITPFGQEQRGIENPVVRAIQSLYNPGNITAPQEIDAQVDAELRRLYDKGQLKQFPTAVDRTFKFMDKTINLDDTEYTQYQRDVGANTISAYKDIINSDEYKKIPAKELTGRLKTLAATRGVKVDELRNQPGVVDRIQEEYRAYLLTKGIQYAKALGQINILRKRGILGKPTDKQLADRMGIPLETARQIN